MSVGNYVTRVIQDPNLVSAAQWDALLLACNNGALNPFVRHAYIAAMTHSASACLDTGWQPYFVSIWEGQDTDTDTANATDEDDSTSADAVEQHHKPAATTPQLLGICPMYIKSHSYGEYVFDFAWARAYQEHGLDYYPKAVIAPPFTPVPGPRLLAATPEHKRALARAAIDTCAAIGVSSLHALFVDEADRAACEDAGMLLRQTVQFHWHNTQPGYADFDAFLATMAQDKRKKIKQERRKVADAGVRFEAKRGTAISEADWQLFYQCYEQTYLEHGNAPYLTPAFFQAMRTDMPDNWLMFVAHTDAGQAFACSLIGLELDNHGAAIGAFGRYWGALARVDCLHFEACYYQPLVWCIANGVQRFEGGAQGEHKMARALMPQTTHSAHWLAHPSFAEAVDRYLERETKGLEAYVQDLQAHSPFKRAQDATSV
jgi:uncharacterized protein